MLIRLRTVPEVVCNLLLHSIVDELPVGTELACIFRSSLKRYPPALF